MAYGRFGYPVVRRRTGETEIDYWRRRSDTRQRALEAWRTRREVERAKGAVNVRESFDSWTEFVDRAARSTSYRDTSHSAGNDWAGGVSFDGALQLARDGWAEGADRLADMTARLEGRLANRVTVQTPGYSVAGPGVLDMGRYLTGHPEAFMVWKDSETVSETESPRGVLRILINGCSSWHVDAETIFWRGAAAVAIVDMAERAGARCEVEMVERVNCYGDGGYNTADTRILLKRAQDHVETDLLAYALAHPATLRRLTFGYWETLSETERAALQFVPYGTYGTPGDVPADERDGLIYIPALLGRGPFASGESTAQWVIAELAKNGIEVETT